MDALLAQLQQYINLDQETLILAGIFIAVTLIILSVALFFTGFRSPVQKKLGDIRKSMDGGARVSHAHKIDNTLESLAPLFSPKSQKERESVRHQLMHAGFHSSSVLSQYYALKMLSIVIGCAIAAGVFFFQTVLPYANLLMLLAFAVGFFLPNVVLNKLVNKRQTKIRRAIPDALDLLVVCTESGLGFNAALKKFPKNWKFLIPILLTSWIRCAPKLTPALSSMMRLKSW